MKDFKQVKINSHQLQFLSGQSMPHSVYQKLLTKAEYNTLSSKQLENMPFKVADIIKTGALKLTSSNDPRYDKQEPIMFAVNQLRTFGLPKQLRGEILSDKYCITKQRLSAKYFILNDVLTEAQLSELYTQLKAKLDYHTANNPDLMGGILPSFTNFSTNTVLANLKDYTPKKPKNNGTKSIGKVT